VSPKQWLAIGVTTILLASTVIFAMQSRTLKQDLSHSKQLLENSRYEEEQAKNDMQRISEEHEKLQADVLAYISTNMTLRKDNAELQSELVSIQETVTSRVADLKRVQEKIEVIERRSVLDQEGSSLSKEKIKKLNIQLSLLEASISKKQSLYYYNLGVVYTEGGQFGYARLAYQKSLKLNPSNADTHYNLALIFEKIESNPVQAVSHYQKYLEFKPDAEDRHQVKSWIENLRGGPAQNLPTVNAS
jgi:tetratricopeptide (TPR) repeat protein